MTVGLQNEINAMTSQSLTRVKNDKYFTEAKLTQLLLDNVTIEGDIFEPCAGERDIAKCLHESLYTPGVDDKFGEVRGTVRASDLTDCAATGYGHKNPDAPKDATTPEFWDYHTHPSELFRLDWTVTNPPFNVASKILPLAYENSRRGVAMLLRLTYLEPCANRAQWLAENCDQLRFVIPVNPRPKFRADSRGTDSCTVAWFVWEKSHSWKAHGFDCPFVFAAGWNR